MHARDLFHISRAHLEISRRQALQGLAGTAFAAGCASPLAAWGEQAPWPSRPVRMVLPYAAGGPVDVIARKLADTLGQKVGQNVVVDNKSGAGGSIGTAEVARAPADGYTLLITINDSLVHSTALLKALPYEPVRDFAPITQVAAAGPVLMTYGDYPVASMQELVAASKAGAPVAYGSWGPGSTPQLVMEVLARETGAKLTHVPYRGANPSIQDVMAKQIPLAFGPAPMILASGGKLKALAALGERRSPLLPGVPTFAESGLKHPLFRMSTWVGVAAPAATPPAVRARIVDAFRTAAQAPEMAAQVRALGFEMLNSTPEQFSVALREELAVIPRLIREAGVEPQ